MFDFCDWNKLSTTTAASLSPFRQFPGSRYGARNRPKHAQVRKRTPQLYSTAYNNSSHVPGERVVFCVRIIALSQFMWAITQLLVINKWKRYVLYTHRYIHTYRSRQKASFVTTNEAFCLDLYMNRSTLYVYWALLCETEKELIVYTTLALPSPASPGLHGKYIVPPRVGKWMWGFTFLTLEGSKSTRTTLCFSPYLLVASRNFI